MIFLLLLPFSALIPIPFALRLIRTDTLTGRFTAGLIRLPFRMQHGQLILLTGRGSVSPAQGGAKQLQQLRAFLRANRCRSLLRRFLRLHRLTILLRLATQDAARCALLTGSLRAVAAFLPPDFRRRACIRIQPDFFSSRSSWYAECMVSIPLGILLITGLMAAAAWLKESRARKPAGKEA
ncbi:MAG: hypothetical protein IJ507_03645 [Clostridia bacterium]|nr:hypothetical protein [Clostridia bacterium]